LGPGSVRDEILEENRKRFEGELLKAMKKRSVMHYRNGREAKNGDKIVSLGRSFLIEAVGVLFDATSEGGNHCNGQIAPVRGGPVSHACLCDCLHVEDLYAILKEKGLHKRPDGK
jgi:hypothetical protein